MAPAPQSPPKARPRLRCLRLVDGEPDGLANQARARTCFPRFGLVADVEQSPSEARDRCDPGCRRISQPGALRKERCLDRAADGTRRSPQLILFRISRLGGCIMSIFLVGRLSFLLDGRPGSSFVWGTSLRVDDLWDKCILLTRGLGASRSNDRGDVCERLQ